MDLKDLASAADEVEATTQGLKLDDAAQKPLHELWRKTQFARAALAKAEGR